MRLSKARIAPLSDAELSEDQSKILAGFRGPDGKGHVLNIFRTMARAPKGLARFHQWGAYIMSRRNELPARERELVILRTGFNCGSGYEWTQHAPIGQRVGLTTDEIDRIKIGPSAPEWSDQDRALLSACDELNTQFFVTDATWNALSNFSDKQKMDMVFSIGQYTQVSMFLNSFGVQLDEGQSLDPDLIAHIAKKFPSK